ncbi:MFS transporter [Skeletonema marinoi]|uniref:MFS transporter n=1 Tax=Skeletonema marinoi TaxID=267567 RepID=A0AAD9DKS2_9STRA|nr:MFS transporter [Skeletonema marinoi]
MPFSKAQRRQIFLKLSSIVEHSFLDDADSVVGVIPSPKPKPTHQVKRPTAEKVTSRRRHIESFIVVYTMIFFNGCEGCFTAVVPSIPFYLQQLAAPPSFMGLVVSAYSLGQIIGSACIAGWSNDKFDSKTLLTLTSMSGIVATLFYVITANHWYVLFSRWLTGVSAGWEFTTEPELAFISSNTSAKERTVFLSSVTAVNLLGFIIGPALSTLLSMLNFEFMGLAINEYTGPGWLLVVLFVVDLILVRVFFSSSLSEEHSQLLINGKNENQYGTIVDEESDRVESQVIREQRLPSLRVMGSLIFIQFSLMCCWSQLETIASLLAGDSFGWHIHECNVLFICGGAASLLAYVTFFFASKRIEDRFLIAYAIIACVAGLLLMITWSSRFLICGVLLLGT